MAILSYIPSIYQALQHETMRTIVLQSTVCPSIFVMQILECLHNRYGLDLIKLDLHDNADESLFQLQSSFLGMSRIYWLCDITGLKPKIKQAVIELIASYQGPHKLIVFCDDKIELAVSAYNLLIPIKSLYFIQDAKSLWKGQDNKESMKLHAFTVQLYKIKQSFTLDELCLLYNYIELVGADGTEFFATWVRRLILPEASLYSLSQFLFEKKQHQFFSLWFSIRALYPDMFWISFWSDQIYRSYFFIASMQKNHVSLAKQVSFGLSFVFIKQTYKQYKLDELQKFHQAIYDVDTQLKHGGHTYLLDKLYIDFFVDSFKN